MSSSDFTKAQWQSEHEVPGDFGPLRAAAEEVVYEVDQYYDVDDGIGNFPGPIMEAVEKLRHALKSLGE